MQTPNPERTLVYISYSHRDREWDDRLRKVLDADPEIRDLVWDDTKIPATADWRSEIQEHFARARILIMLGSPDYFAPGCGAEELEIRPGVAAHNMGKLKILWFLVRSHPIYSIPVRDIMAATGTGATPLDGLAPADQDAALHNINQQVRSLLGLDTDTMNTSTKRFEIALSFPGERRAFVEQVAEQLAEHVGRERVLYDRWYEAELARVDLDTYLQALYHDQSELIVIFLSAEYERKDWCGLEWKAVRDLIKRRRTAGIMPLRFDNTEIPGLFSTDGYCWIGERTANEIADLIFQRWKTETGGRVGAGSPPAALTPVTAAAAIPTRAPNSSALALWRKKLDFLLTEEAKLTDAEQKFSIQARIAECREKIRELGGTP